MPQDDNMKPEVDFLKKTKTKFLRNFVSVSAMQPFF